jgi:hypothetical protein
MNRITRFAERLGGKLGTVVCLVGALVLYLGWNGAASHNDIRKQFPYLLSGGIAGLALVILGVSLLVIEAVRTERTALQETLRELRDALEALAPRTALGAGTVVAGASSFHRPTCRLVESRDDLDLIGPDEAATRGLTPCRICHPDASTDSNGTRESARTT